MTEQTAPKEKKEPVVTTVTMEDGRVVEFAGKRRIIKNSEIVDGQLVTTIDFVNGKSVVFRAPKDPKFLALLAGHGAEQKLGDAAAGAETIEDAFEAVAEVAIRMENGEWNAKREPGSSAAGGSILVKALAEFRPNLTIEQVRQFLAGKSQAEKMALRNSAALRPIVQRLEAEKAARSKTPGVDAEALLGQLDA